MDLKLLLFHPNFFLLLTTSTSHVFCPTYSHCFHIQYYLKFVYSDFLFIFTNSKVFFFYWVFIIYFWYFMHVFHPNSIPKLFFRSQIQQQTIYQFVHPFFDSICSFLYVPYSPKPSSKVQTSPILLVKSMFGCLQHALHACTQTYIILSAK